MKRTRLSAWITPLAACFVALVARAAPAPAAPDPPSFKGRAELLERARASVVGVVSRAVDEAASNETLGRERHGSGVVIGADGLVLTIGYLILEAEQVDLLVGEGHVVPARVVAYDLASGFGLLQALAPMRVAPVPLGHSAGLAPDEPLLIASGEDDVLGVARLVAQRAFSGYWEYHIERALFTMPARSDHSGAGLFNLDGELLGIGSLMVSEALGEAGGRMPGNMFVPIELLEPIFGELRQRGASRDSTRAWLGLNCVERGGQVHVLHVTPEGPAERAGVQPGDRILRIDGTEVRGLEVLYKTLWRDGVERDVTLLVDREGERRVLTAHSLDRMKTLRKPEGI